MTINVIEKNNFIKILNDYYKIGLISKKDFYIKLQNDLNDNNNVIHDVFQYMLWKFGSDIVEKDCCFEATGVPAPYFLGIKPINKIETDIKWIKNFLKEKYHNDTIYEKTFRVFEILLDRFRND